MRPAKHDDLWTELNERFNIYSGFDYGVGQDPADEKPGMFTTWTSLVKFMGKMMGVLLLFAVAIAGIVYLVGANLR